MSPEPWGIHREWLDLEPKAKPYEPPPPPTVEQRLASLEWQVSYQRRQLSTLRERLLYASDVLRGEHDD